MYPRICYFFSQIVQFIGIELLVVISYDFSYFYGVSCNFFFISKFIELSPLPFFLMSLAKGLLMFIFSKNQLLVFFWNLLIFFMFACLPNNFKSDEWELSLAPKAIYRLKIGLTFSIVSFGFALPMRCLYSSLLYIWLPRWLSDKKKNLPANAGDMGSILGSERSPGEENGSVFQYSCLGNPMDRGAWRATVHGVTKEDRMYLLTNNNNNYVCTRLL